MTYSNVQQNWTSILLTEAFCQINQAKKKIFTPSRRHESGGSEEDDVEDEGEGK